MTLFKDRLKELRLERGLTQEQLAEQMDIPASSIRRLEVSDSIPRRERLLSFSTFFGESIDYLMGNTNERQRDKKEENKFTPTEEELSRERTEYVIRSSLKSTILT